MSEDDIVELLWKSGQVVRSSQTQRPPSVTPPIILLSGSGNAPLPQPPPLHSHQQPYDQNLLIRRDKMASWLHHHPLCEDEFRSNLFYSGAVSIPLTQPQGSVSLPPPLSPPPSISAMYTPTAAERTMGQVIAERRAANFINFSRLIANTYTGGRVEAAELVAVPSLSRKAIEMVCEIAGPSSPGVSKAETELIQIQPVEKKEAVDERKRKEREEPANDTEETAQEVLGSTFRKRSRAAQMHNISGRRRREKINEKMKALQELIPCCNRTDKASVLEDATEYLKSLKMQIQMMSMGGGGMMPMMMSTPNMQRFMPHTEMGEMGMNQHPFIPFRGRAFHMAGLGPSYPAQRYPFPNNQAFDPSKVHLPSQQPDPVSNQPQFPGYLNPLQNQTTSS